MSLAEASPPSGTAIVPSDLDVVTDEKTKLNVVEAARVAQVSESTIRRAIARGLLPARKRGKSFTIMRDVIVQVAPQLRERAPSRRLEESRAAGEVAADAFEAFERGDPLTSIVQRLRLDPRVVDDLFDRWVGLQKKQREAVTLRCLHAGADCRGSILPYVALCDGHAARSRVLTQEQELVLRGQEVPTAITCTCCGRTAGRGVCSSCTSSLSVDIVGEGTGRRLVVRAPGDHVVLVVGAEQSRELARQLLGPPKTVDPPTTEKETT